MDDSARFNALAKRLCDVMEPVIVINTLTGETLEANAAYQDLTGYSLEALRRLKYQDITPAKWHHKEARLFDQVCKRGYSYKWGTRINGGRPFVIKQLAL